MNIETHIVDDLHIAEIKSSELLIASIDDGVDLVGNLYFQGINKVILHQKNITPSFFDLKNGMAGEILQKFSTYRIQLVIVGDFSIFASNSLNDFIYESNQGMHIHFLESVPEAVLKLANK
jgi:Domain of unknown function (DUF4180)